MFVKYSFENYSSAQSNLGLIYYEGKYVTRDINKAIHYYSLAANQSHADAQFYLGLIYYTCSGIQHNVKKGRYYIMLASKNGNRPANFTYGFLLHEGKSVERDIEEAVHYYKEASSFNIEFAKNNLGVIYRHGYGKTEGRTGNAIVYFEEAIRQKNDILSMYNLAHIYIYDDQDINKSIELLIRSSNIFDQSLYLLSIVVMKQFGFDVTLIQQEIQQRTEESSKLSTRVIQIIYEYELFEKSNLEYYYELFRNREFLYDFSLRAVLLSDLENANKKDVPKYPRIKDISAVFYEGFGEDIISSW